MSYVRVCDRCDKELTDFTHHYITFDQFKIVGEFQQLLLCQTCYITALEILRFNLFTVPDNPSPASE